MTQPAQTKVRLKDAAVVFLRIANVTFGGGDPTMAALEREMVARRGWLGTAQYALAYSLARITPGTNMVAFCVAVGWYLNGWPGAIAAALAVTLPSAALCVWITWAYQGLKADPLATAAISGTLAAAVGMMFAAAWHLVRPHFDQRRWPRTLVLAGGSILLAAGFGFSPIAVLGLAAVAGFFWTGDQP